MARVLVTGFLIILAASVWADVVTRPASAFGYGEVSRGVLSPNGQYLATAGQSGAFIWNYEKRTMVHRLDAYHVVTMAIAFSPESRVLLTGGRDGVIREWDTETGELLRERFGHGGEINSLAFSADGLKIASASGDNTAKIWSSATGKVLSTLTVTGQWVHAVAFSPDGSLVATADSSITNSIRIWNSASGALERTLGLHIGGVYELSFLPDGRLATAGDDRKVRVWNPATGDLIRLLDGGPSLITGLSAGLNTVVAGFASGWISVWDVNTGVATKNIPNPAIWDLSPGTNENGVIVVYPDLVVRELELDSETFTAEFEGHSTSTTLGVTFTPDGRHVFSGGTEPNVRMWDRTNATLSRVMASSGGGTAATLLSADGRHLLTTAGAPSPKLRLWNVDSGDLEREFTWAAGFPAAAAYSANGAWVAAGTMASQVHLFNVSTAARTTLSGHANAVRSLAFSPDGLLLASGDAAGSVRIWNGTNGNWLRSIDINAGWVTAVAFSPITNELMTASEDGFLNFWNPQTGAWLRTITVTGGFLESAAYSPNGKYVVNGTGWPFLVGEVWKAQTGELLRVLGGHSSPVQSVAFSPDGLSILTGSDVVRLWDISDLLSRVHARTSGPGVELRWEQGTLQSAPSVLGPWNDVTNASPVVRPSAASAEFYRIKLID